MYNLEPMVDGTKRGVLAEICGQKNEYLYGNKPDRKDAIRLRSLDDVPSDTCPLHSVSVA